MEHNKLVRDNIPNIIEKNGEVAETRILNDEEYKQELYKKLLEEANEVINSNRDTTIEELADVLEVLIAIAKINGKDLDDIVKERESKRIKRGSFDKKVYLVKTYKK